MFIIKYQKFFFSIAIITIVFSLFAMISKGFNVGMDFEGGSIIEVAYDVRPDIETLKGSLDKAGFASVQIQMAGENDVIVRTEALSETDRQKLTGAPCQ